MYLYITKYNTLISRKVENVIYIATVKRITTALEEQLYAMYIQTANLNYIRVAVYVEVSLLPFCF